MNGWKFENSGFHTGARNMEYDEALAKSCLEGTGGPTVRVYGWNPEAISLGWSQSLDDIDTEKANAEGIDVVRRPTGGRAILHSDELTYCVVMPSDGKRVLAVYDEISKALVCGLRKLGVNASLEKCQPHFPSVYALRSSVACFTSAARYEVKVNGRKIVGSAQRRYSKGDGREVVLQHGSVLLGEGHERIAEFLKLPGDERIAVRQELKNMTSNLKSLIGKDVAFGEVADALRQGFESAWGMKFQEISSPMVESLEGYPEF